MEKIKKRIFICNLPSDVTEKNIKRKFRRFGSATNIEIKHNSDITTPLCFAFLDLETDATRLDSCFEKSSIDWNGHSVKIEFAKESFLSRLQKERQQVNAKTSENAVPKFDYTTSSRPTGHLKGMNQQICNLNKKRNCVDNDNSYSQETKPSSIDLEDHKKVNPASSEESVARGLLQKFESFSDVWKDPPTFGITTSNKKQHKNYEHASENDFKTVAHSKKVVQTDRSFDKMGVKSPSKKIFASEEKRLNSLKERERTFLQQKAAVKLALASVDSAIKTNKKIIFDDDMNEEICYPSNNVKQLDKSHNSRPTSKSRGGPRLFEDETLEEEQDYNFDIRRQFEGRKGQKLLDLQSRYANDKRFTLDERFYESDDAQDDETQPPEKGSIEEERRKQLDILQSIVGSHLPHAPEGKKTKAGNVDNMIVHYDPIIDDHAKYEIKRVEKKKVAASFNTRQERRLDEKRAKKKQKRELLAPQLPTVSKEKFYKVSETLKESLKSDAKGFSLLETFGSLDENKKTAASEDTYSFIRTNNKKSLNLSSNPFKWDSSDSEDETKDVNDAPSSPQRQNQSEGVTQGRGMWRESFFFKTNDERLTEGLKFFSRENVSNEDFSRQRRLIQKIVSTKIRKNMRKATGFRNNRGRRGRGMKKKN